MRAVAIGTLYFSASTFRFFSSADRQQRVSDSTALWGHKWIVLPNAYYGDWEGALYKDYLDSHNYLSPPLLTKDTLREKQLSTYDYLGKGH